MRYRIILAAFASFAFADACAQFWVAARVSDLRLSVMGDESRGFERLTVEAQLDYATNRLTRFDVFLDERRIAIPLEDFSALLLPRLNSLEIRYRSDEKTAVYIYVPHDPEGEASPEHEIATLFEIRAGQYVGSSVLDVLEVD